MTRRLIATTVPYDADGEAARAARGLAASSEVVLAAPSDDPARRADGRRLLRRLGAGGDLPVTTGEPLVVAYGEPGEMDAPGVRAALRELALRGRFDAVEGIEAPPAESPERVRVDFHLHTYHSSDCATGVRDLVEAALRAGLGGIAVTDHNTIAGGVETAAYVREHGIGLDVIVGSEVKTQEGEVIGLYLEREIERGMSFDDTVAAIREQGGLVYVPHPFDRLHSIPSEETLERLIDRLDVFETFNARLPRPRFNDEAKAFAERHGLRAGAGSDAHVLQGLGTGSISLPRFEGREELLVALGAGRVVHRPANLLLLQARKWVAQARKRFGPQGRQP